MRHSLMSYLIQGLIIAGVFAALVFGLRTFLLREPDAEASLPAKSLTAKTDDFPKLDAQAFENGGAGQSANRNVGDEAVPLTGFETATFGSGCFWCTEAVFEKLNGVESVASGYSGGHIKNPSYDAICTGATGHAEVVQLKYDPAIVSYPELLEIFWRTHDPTTPNQQGNDVGPQYRSAIFYHNERQREMAEKYRQLIDEAGVFDAPLVTEISPFTAFYEAEFYHQDYFTQHSRQPYCQYVIQPKVDKLEKIFGDKLK